MKENKPLYYIPNTVQIGCTTKLPDELLESVCRTSEMDKVGIPSCRFMLNKWTDINLFERMTGFRPTNMVNKEKEIKKMLSGSVFEIENVPTSGFKLIDIKNDSLYEQARYLSYGKIFAYIYDPRGFIFCIQFSDFWKMLFKNNISIDKDKTISGRFLYSWKQRYPTSNDINLSLINENDMVSTDEYDIIKESDLIDNRKENPGIKAKDFVPGTVYDYNNNGQIERVLFVGKYNMYSLTALKGFYNETFGGNLLMLKESAFTNRSHIYWYKSPKYYFDKDKYDNFIKLMDKSKKYNVFLTLSPEYSWYHNDYTNLMSVKNNPDKDDFHIFSYLYNMKFLNGGVNIVKISDNQDICLDTSINTLNPDQSKYQFKTIVNRMNDKISVIDKHVAYIKSKFDGKTTDEIIDIVKNLDVDEAKKNGFFR